MQSLGDVSSPPLQATSYGAMQGAELLSELNSGSLDSSKEEKNFLQLSLPRKAQTLVRFHGDNNGFDRAYWIVDSKKLKSNTKVVVSPPFTVSMKRSMPHLEDISMKFVMHPAGGDRESFKTAGGRGYVQLKCESDTLHYEKCPLTFRLGISSGCGDDKWLAAKGPVTHDFAVNVICDLQAYGYDVWDFPKVLDGDTRGDTFAVCLEILPWQ